MAALIKRIHIQPDHWQEMLEHVSKLDPEEACGLAAGKQGLTRRIYLIENSLHSQVSFQMEPHQQVKAILEMEDQGWDMLAIFHSHPDGPQLPSPTDIEKVTYPETVNLIWSKLSGEWTCRGFLIQKRVVTEIPIQISKKRVINQPRAQNRSS